MGAEFVDTNVLVYALDASAGDKHRLAAELVGRLAREQLGALSVQVLMELYVTLTRKVPARVSEKVAMEVASDFTAWTVFSPDASDAIEAMRIAQRYRIGPWDALVIRAAAALGASILWTEDLSHGQTYEGVAVRNPFRG